VATAAEVIAGTADWGIDCCDALAGLRDLPDGCVQCCLTSPPFYSLRDYGTAKWEGGSPDCDHRSPTMKDGRNEDRPTLAGSVATNAAQLRLAARSACGKCGARRVDQQIGLEADLSAYVARLVEVFREVRRVLHPSGLLLLNVGDSYNSGAQYNGHRRKDGTTTLTPGAQYKERDESWPGHRPLLPGLKPKDLLGTPWTLAFALRADGWYLRCAPPWVKDNCMPESVRDRPTTAHEYWFLLAKGPRYFWDADAVRRPHEMKPQRRPSGRPEDETPRPGQPKQSWPKAARDKVGVDGHPAGRNLRTSDVFNQSLDDLIEHERAWLAHLEHVRAQGGMLLDREGDPLALLYATHPCPPEWRRKHFALFNPHMLTPLLKAATSEKGCCPACGAPWARQTERRDDDRKPYRTVGTGPQARLCRRDGNVLNKVLREDGRGGDLATATVFTTGWRPSCACPPADAVPCLVLDCFAGLGTVGLVARRLGRRFVGLDLNAEYCDMARRRIESDAPLFNGAAPAPASAPPPGRTLFDSPAPEED
jgi:hypothetical protein